MPLDRKTEESVRKLVEAIKMIKPIISRIRELGNSTKELTALQQKAKESESELQENIEKGISTDEHIKRVNSLTKIYKDCKKYQTICEEIEGELISYKQYASACYCNLTVLKTTFKLKPIQDKDEYLALIFMLLNNDHNIDTEELMTFIKESFPDDVDEACGLLQNGWEYMLKELKENKI